MLMCKMNVKLGVILIEVETYARMILNNFAEGSSV